MRYYFVAIIVGMILATALFLYVLFTEKDLGDIIERFCKTVVEKAVWSALPIWCKFTGSEMPKPAVKPVAEGYEDPVTKENAEFLSLVEKDKKSLSKEMKPDMPIFVD